LSDSFLVALHGATNKTLSRGYSVVRVSMNSRPSARPEDFITGFLQGERVHGRPADILKVGANAFLMTDDHAGVVYYVYKK